MDCANRKPKVGSDALMGWCAPYLRVRTNVVDSFERCLRKGKGMYAVLVRRQPVGKLAGPLWLGNTAKRLFALHCWQNSMVHSRRQNTNNDLCSCFFLTYNGFWVVGPDVAVGSKSQVIRWLPVSRPVIGTRNTEGQRPRCRGPGAYGLRESKGLRPREQWAAYIVCRMAFVTAAVNRGVGISLVHGDAMRSVPSLRFEKRATV